MNSLIVVVRNNSLSDIDDDDDDDGIDAIYQQYSAYKKK